MKLVAFAGAGFASAVLARELANSGQFKCAVFDERSHVGGNCHTERDSQTNVMIHRYGPHIFHTSNDEVWSYVQKFATMMPFVNRVKAHTDRGVFSLPINLMTINQFFGRQMNPSEAAYFIDEVGDKNIAEPKSFEEQALKFVGKDLYENFFEGYTLKQWGLSPKDLPASILKRLPLRFNYDDNYYASKYQGIPKDGYTELVTRILDHPAIEVRLSQVLTPRDRAFDHIFWSGPIDLWFGHDEGRLRYRSLKFEEIRANGDYQGNAVINYCSKSVPFTRVSEHKHFAPWESHAGTVCYRETSKLAEDGDIPYYPLRLVNDSDLLESYVKRARDEKCVSFIGRLGTYRYLDMHQIIDESLQFSKIVLKANNSDQRIPSFYLA